MADDSMASTSAGSVRGDAWATVAAFLGALGVGFIFAKLWSGEAGWYLFGSTYWLSADPTWPRLVPALAVATIMLAAVLAGRWGWVVACVGLALHFGVHEFSLGRWLDYGGTALVLVAAGTAGVGGALAAFGVADRAGRLAIGAGLALGVYSHLTPLDAPLAASSTDTRLRLLTPLALCAVAAVVWFVRGTGRSGPGPSVPKPSGSGSPGSAGGPAAEAAAETVAVSGATGAPPARRPWVTVAMAVGAAVGVTLLYLGLMAVLDSVARRSGSQRRQEMVELLYQVGLFGIVVAVGVVLGIYAYRRSGSVAARWVLVGLATGTAALFIGGGPALSWVMEPTVDKWLVSGVATAGVLLGAVLSRFALVPWDGLGLVALAVGIVLRSPQGQIELAKQDATVRLFVVFTVGFVFAASLCALATQTALRGLGGPGEAAALVGLGFAASVLATSVIFPAYLLVNQRGSLALGPAIAVGIMAVAALALYGLGLVARFFRRAIEAEARREAGLPSS
ncbi:MAG: hypothetical protein IRY85_18625 [Micromonosporaceae bacterium]|nr:hypothetical protein [Micromonosporaceae bacterium]